MNLGLAPEEMAFYDALETNEESVRLLGDNELKALARELTDYLRNNLKTDWSVRESVRAAMRVWIKLILKRHKYPPDMEQRAVELVLKQAGVVRGDALSAKVILSGKLTRKISLKGVGATKGAKAAIEAAGGSVAVETAE